jgi:hypothetical protein
VVFSPRGNTATKVVGLWAGWGLAASSSPGGRAGAPHPSFSRTGFGFVKEPGGVVYPSSVVVDGLPYKSKIGLGVVLGGMGGLLGSMFGTSLSNPAQLRVEKAASLTDLLQNPHPRLRNADLPPSAGSSF